MFCVLIIILNTCRTNYFLLKHNDGAFFYSYIQKWHCSDPKKLLSLSNYIFFNSSTIDGEVSFFPNWIFLFFISLLSFCLVSSPRIVHHIFSVRGWLSHIALIHNVNMFLWRPPVDRRESSRLFLSFRQQPKSPWKPSFVTSSTRQILLTYLGFFVCFFSWSGKMHFLG